MLSFQSQYELFQSLASDVDATNLTLGKKLINLGDKTLAKALGIYYTEEVKTFTTVTDAITGSSYQDYRKPVGFNSLVDLYVTVGSTQYWADPIHDPRLWRRLNSSTTSSTSNFLENCLIRRDRICLWPIPSSACTATLWYSKLRKDLSAADYTIGTVTTLAAAGKTVTLADSTLTSAMAGRYFKVNSDGEWYRIASITSTTVLVLEQGYEGTAIAAGTEAYTIGEMPITPEETHELPVWYALWKYNRFRKNLAEAKEYKSDWLTGLQEAIANKAKNTASQIVNDPAIRAMRRNRVLNPNDYPEGMT